MVDCKLWCLLSGSVSMPEMVFAAGRKGGKPRELSPQLAWWDLAELVC